MENPSPLLGPIIIASVALFAALLGAFVALFRDQLRRWAHGARFDVTYDHVEPFFQQADAGKTTNHAVRLAVRNRTHNWVKNVIFILNEITADGAPVKGFIPIRLTWTHSHPPKPILDFLAPWQTAYVDFGLLKQNPSDQKPLTGANGLRLDLSAEVDPKTQGCRLLGGKNYEAVFQIFGEDGVHAEGSVSFYFKQEEQAGNVHHGSMKLNVAIPRPLNGPILFRKRS